MGASPSSRVLVLASTFPRHAGDSMPAFVLRLCQAMQAEGWDSLVLAPHAPGLAREEILEGVRCHRFRYAPGGMERLAYGGGMLANVRAAPWLLGVLPFFLGAMLLQSLWLLWRERIRVVHAHWVVPQGVVAALLKCLLGARLRLVMTAHGSDLQVGMGGVVRRLRTWAMLRADVLAVVSDGLREQALAAGVPEARIVVAPMGVDTELFRPPAAQASRSGLLFVGRLVPGKGGEHLLDAFALLAPRHPDLCLTLVGDGPERPVLAARAAALPCGDRIRFAGAQAAEGVAAAMRAAAMLAVPSMAEGLGLVAAEAQACACPVVASDIPGLRDVVVGGVTGVLVPPGDAGALAAALEGLLGDPALAARLAAAGREQVNARFAWPAVARRYRHLYEGEAGV